MRCYYISLGILSYLKNKNKLLDNISLNIGTRMANLFAIVMKTTSVRRGTNFRHILGEISHLFIYLPGVTTVLAKS